MKIKMKVGITILFMIGIILIGIIVFFKIPYSPVRNKFQADIEAKVEEVKGSQEVCTYEEIDDQHVKATVTHKGVSGSGVFTINELGEITEFYSDERQIEEIDGKMMQLGWKCYYSDYQEIDGIKMATKVRSDKIFPDGRELTYFSSDDFDVEHIR